MKIERLQIKNFRVFKDVELTGLSELAVFVGANGTGKSTLFDVFAFLREALYGDVHAALGRRGGFHEVRSRDQEGPISFELDFGDPVAEARTRYVVEIGERDGQAVIEHERLNHYPTPSAPPSPIFELHFGAGVAQTEPGQPLASFELDSPEQLALKGLGLFRQLPVASRIRRHIEDWHTFDFHARSVQHVPELESAEHISRHGENLALVARYLYENHPDRFGALLERMKQRIPGLTHVEATKTVDGRVVLQFQDGAFKDPLRGSQVSSGTLTMFAYLVLMHDPSPHALLCIEEPEHHLYRTLLPELLEELRGYSRRGAQVLVSTHAPELVDAADLSEVYWLEKRGGFSTIHHASDDEQLRALVAEGDPAGALWRQGLFGGIDP